MTELVAGGVCFAAGVVVGILATVLAIVALAHVATRRTLFPRSLNR